MDRAPDHAPEAEHWVALALVHVRVALPPGSTELGVADSCTTGGGPATVTVTV